MSKPRFAAVVAFAVLVPLVLLVVATRDTDDGSLDDDRGAPTTGVVEDPAVPGVAEIGSRAPGFVLETIDGATHSLAGVQGRPVVVTFWASWCLPCLDELPLLQEALDEHGDAFSVLAIGFRNLPSDDADWLAEHDITIPSLQDPDFEVALAYGVRAIPQTFFIDADGVIRDRVFGITTAAGLRAPLDALLAAS
ncbi:MAG TPA: TlpA disulfide reductase family protein [Acidimicrobiia bacterium]|nr:TlpA disulfide reductase family protein [Acidimicrobiia bacterium]